MKMAALGEPLNNEHGNLRLCALRIRFQTEISSDPVLFFGKPTDYRKAMKSLFKSCVLAFQNALTFKNPSRWWLVANR